MDQYLINDRLDWRSYAFVHDYTFYNWCGILYVSSILSSQLIKANHDVFPAMHSFANDIILLYDNNEMHTIILRQ